MTFAEENDVMKNEICEKYQVQDGRLGAC